ncbi:MAG: hypothetical protein Q4C77_15000, partial [Eubacteriales bacterium]|nr:hypothetical protein [Eubacteriales bacterium]
VIIPRMFIESEYMLMLFDVFLTISVVVWSYLFIIRIPWLGDLLQFLGKHSMNIFLLHSFIRGSWFYEWTYSRGHFMIIWIILLLESLMLSVVVEKFKNLIGYNKFIDKIQKKIILM